MKRWSIPVDITTPPTTIVAKEVEYNSETGEFGIKVDGNEYEFSAGGIISVGVSQWYHADIAISGIYSAYWNGTTPIEGYIGNYINAGDNHANILSCIQHLSNTDNPHSVTKIDVGLSNVENKDAATILSELADTKPKFYSEVFTPTGTSHKIDEGTINTACGLATNYYVGKAVIIELWKFSSVTEFTNVGKTNCVITQQTQNAIDCFKEINISSLETGVEYLFLIGFLSVYAPPPSG